MTQVLIRLNFWEYKQLEYWLKDNYPHLLIRSLYDNCTAPEDDELYSIDGALDKEASCLLQLKYGDKIRNIR